jgi:hypothetical protein
MPPSVSAIRNAEHAVDAAHGTPDAGANRAADCATHRPSRTMTLVRALVGSALHTVEDTLSMRLMRYGEKGQRRCNSGYRDPHTERRLGWQCYGSHPHRRFCPYFESS